MSSSEIQVHTTLIISNLYLCGKLSPIANDYVCTSDEMLGRIFEKRNKTNTYTQTKAKQGNLHHSENNNN
jgi:hypothetical protein